MQKRASQKLKSQLCCLFVFILLNILLVCDVELFSQQNTTAFEAIKSATSIAPELLRVDDHTGRIEEGLDAVLIVMEGNPLDDIGAVHDLLMVVNNGKIVADRLVW